MSHFIKYFAYVFAAFAAADAAALELFSDKSDTFIYQSFPSDEFSGFDFIGVSAEEDAKAVAYLPFTLKPLELGMVPENGDRIIEARLELTAKAIPQIDKALTEAESAALAAIKLEVYAIVDEETFLPHENKLKVSWDGQNENPAPTHDTATDDFKTGGVIFLGDIHVNLNDEEFLKTHKIIFKEDSLKEFLNFACGAKDATLSFTSPLNKLDHITLIIRQVSGAKGVLICSANYAEKQSAGDLSKPHDEAEAQAQETAASASEIGAEQAQTAIFETQKLGDLNEKPDRTFRPKIILEFAKIKE